MNNKELKRDIAATELDKAELLMIDNMIRDLKDLGDVAEKIIDGAFKSVDIMKKDSVDRFIDYVMAKVKTGSYHILSLAFPTRRMADKDLELKIIELINVHMYPDIVLPILKYFARNIKDSDRNLYLAYLINSPEIVKSIYDTFLLFRKDIFIPDENKRSLNVKRIQQFPPTTDNKFSSPLDAACRFKYILEFIALKQNVESIYTDEDIKLTAN